MSKVGRFPGLIARRPVRGSPIHTFLDDQRRTSEFVCTSGELGQEAFENSVIELGPLQEVDGCAIVSFGPRHIWGLI